MKKEEIVDVNKFHEDQEIRKEKDKIIGRQLRFQELLISISTQYINSDL
jgi:hypothetical protein